MTSHLSWQIIALAPAYTAGLRDLPDTATLATGSGLGLSAQTLCRYAQSGGELDAEAIDYVQSLAEALYTRPGTGGVYDIPEIDGDADLATTWGVVIVAAIARDKINTGQPVSSRELATLASISQRQIQQLTAERRLKRTRLRQYSAAEATRFLRERGVVGF